MCSGIWRPVRPLATGAAAAQSGDSAARLAVKLWHRLVFGGLSSLAARHMQRHHLCTVEEVHGLYETGRFTEDYWLALLDHLSAATHEVYCHPEVASPMLPRHNARGPDELAALLSPRLRDDLRRRRIQMVTHADLS